MSTINVNKIQDAGGTKTLIDYSNGSVSGPLTVGGRRNLIINGAMQVAQRGTSVTGVTAAASYHTVDRFRVQNGSLGVWTVEQSTDAPNGFSNSFKLTCTTADASPAANDYLLINYYPEAQDLQCLGYGTSDAKALTLSFWVKSNKTGTATVNVIQQDNAYKQVTPSYTINSADTWEHKTILIPADTSGVINNDNAAGFGIDWWLNSGSTYTGGGNRTDWTAGSSSDRNASNLGVGGATSDYLAITGVQLEVGDVATPFEHRSYGEELALCQRYYIQYNYDGVSAPFCNACYYSSGSVYGVVNFPVIMRANPSLNNSSITNQFRMYSNNNDDHFTTIAYQSACKSSYAVYNGGQVSGTAGHAGWIELRVSGAYIAFDAEL